MCVIAVKPEGVAMLSENRIKDMFIANPDGAGFMYVRDKKVHIRKGFMKVKHFLRAIAESRLSASDLIVMHFRIATAGSVSPKNTHPFPVSREIDELQATSITTDLAVAHNGILPYPNDKKNDLSDTMTFIKEILAQEAVCSNMEDSAVFSLIEMSVGTNRLVFVNGKGEFGLMGSWEKDKVAEDGCLYSNLVFVYRAKHAMHFIDHRRALENDNFGSKRTDYKNYSNIVTLFPRELQCPQCDTVIDNDRQSFCRKCGIMFDRGV